MRIWSMTRRRVSRLLISTGKFVVMSITLSSKSTEELDNLAIRDSCPERVALTPRTVGAFYWRDAFGEGRTAAVPGAGGRALAGRRPAGPGAGRTGRRRRRGSAGVGEGVRGLSRSSPRRGTCAAGCSPSRLGARPICTGPGNRNGRSTTHRRSRSTAPRPPTGRIPSSGRPSRSCPSGSASPSRSSTSATSTTTAWPPLWTPRPPHRADSSATRSRPCAPNSEWTMNDLEVPDRGPARPG